MTFEEEMAFLAQVRHYAKAKPENLHKLLTTAVQGIIEHVATIRAHAVDMEVVASMAMNTRLFKGNEKFLADKLESWKHMNGLRWDDQIKALRERVK